VKILYLAPDTIPSPKGAAVRIRRTLETMRALGHEVESFTPPAVAAETNFLDRMLRFRTEAAAWLRTRRADLVQFRGIWEGVSALEWARATGARAIYEVHGLPSIELPYHFPSLLRHERVLDKLVDEERHLLDAVDRVVVPSRTNARFIRRLGVAASRIHVVPNAVDAEAFIAPAAPPADGAPLRLVYVGTLSPWQGLGTLIEALALLRAPGAYELHVIGPTKSVWRNALRRLARRLRVHHLLHLSGPMQQPDLVPVLQTAHVCVAPLPEDPRNALQGCCPLKILEYMATARPILSTRIAPVLEVLEHERNAHLVPAGSAAALADGLLWMKAHPAEREALGRQAREDVVRDFHPGLFAERLATALAGLDRPRRAGTAAASVL
jgi:glycosyltransferase involved in cell wall biosynthesis